MEICYQKTKTVIYSEACPEKKLRALAAAPETKLLTDCCRLACRYANEDLPEQVPGWFNTRFMKFCKDSAKDKNTGANFLKKTQKQKLQLFADDQKGRHPFINFCAKGYDETEVKDKQGNKKKGPWRKQKAVHLSGLVAIDIDHVENPKAIFERWQKVLDFKALKIYLIYITPREGLRVVFRCEAGRGNLMDNQKWMCEKLGVEPDASCKDASRGYFLTSTENFLYDNLKEMYEDEADEAFISQFEPEYRAGRSRSAKTDAVANASVKQGSVENRAVDVETTQELNWYGYDIQDIIDAWSTRHFGDNTQDVSRHEASLVLAKDLFIMFDRDKDKTLKALQAQKWVQAIIEERNEDVERTVSNAADYVEAAESEAAKKGKNWTPKPSKEMQDAIKVATGKTYQCIIHNAQYSNGCATNEADMTNRLSEWGEEIKALWDDFPMLKDVCAGLKTTQYPAALFVAGGVEMTLMTCCWYRFYHRPQQLRRLNCSLFVIGHPASNKSMADDLYKILAEPIVKADQAGLAALNRYKQDTKKKAANKEGKDRPKSVIRIHPARTSNGQLIQDMINAKEIVEGKEMQLHMLTFDTELDNSIQLQKGGSWINKQSLELKAFHNEEDGQMYQNQDSPVDSFNVTWNYIYTGTPIALKSKVNERNFGSGLSTRLAVIPMPKTNYEMLAFEEVESIDWARLERMKEWAFKLDARAGELPLWPLVKQLYDWTKNRMEDCKEDDSEANELMLKRVPYHALNYAAPFIDMRHWDSLRQEGNHWTGTYEVDEKDWKLCELIARIQYATQQHFFGVMAEKYFDDMNSDVQTTGKRHQQKSVDGFNSLPDVFTPEDVQRCFGYSSIGSIRSKIKRLIDSCHAEKITKGNDKGKYRKMAQMYQ
ncbi:MAG: hypothetical protein J5658_11610 [Prevotella sp.]|nr:hypothetical protein [Prevotella sp.]